MNATKYLGFAGLAAAGLFATQAFATTCPVGTQGSPVCVATDGGGSEPSLEELLDGITKTGTTNNIDVYNGQTSPSAYWSIGATGSSENTKMFQVTANAGNISFGIFDPTNASNYISLFGTDAGQGWSTSLKNQGDGNYIVTHFDANGLIVGPQNTTHFGVNNLFGYYIQFGSTLYYSDPLLNNGNPHMVAIGGDGSTTLCITSQSACGLFQPGEFILAWEDGAWGQSDLDYNDFVVMVESVHPVPEPATLGMFGFGVLLIGAAVGFNRRRRFNIG